MYIPDPLEQCIIVPCGTAELDGGLPYRFDGRFQGAAAVLWRHYRFLAFHLVVNAKQGPTLLRGLSGLDPATLRWQAERH